MGTSTWQVSTWFIGWENLLAWFPVAAAIFIMIGLGMVLAKIRYGWIVAMVGFGLVFMILWRGSLPGIQNWLTAKPAPAIAAPSAPPPPAKSADKNPSQKRPRSQMAEGDKKALRLLDESDALLK